MGFTRLHSLALGLLLAWQSAPAFAGTPALDGTLLSSEPCPPNPIASHEDFLASTRAFLAREATLAAEEEIAMPPVDEARLHASLAGAEEVADHLAYAGFECREIRYASGGLVIAGYLWKPVDTDGRRLPLVIANRGGNGRFGAMTPWRHWGWHEFLRAGYVVLASQYRGGPDSEGEDEFGGADLDDVRALIPLARSLGYVDTGNVFLWGGSRGGMMAYMLAREGLPVRAIGIRAGLADLFAAAAQRPGIEEQLWSRRMPDYAAGREAALARRSAVRWAEEIRVPAILFHGSDDWRADVADPLKVAQGLAAAGTPFELHVYAGDTHAITLNERDMMRRAVAFFDRFRTPAEDE